METKIKETCHRSRRARVGIAAAVGTLAAGVPAGLSHASTPDPDAAAGEALGDLADRGATFYGTYGVPAAIIVIGASFGFFLLMKLSKKLRGAA